MRETRDLKLDEVLDELYHLREENAFLQRQNTALKMRCSNYCLQVQSLESELADLKFSQTIFNDDLSEEKAIADGEAHYETFAFLGDDF